MNTLKALSPKESLFIDSYMVSSDPAIAAEDAGYSIRTTVKNPHLAYLRKGREILAKDYIQDEIARRQEIITSERIADAKEVMEFYTAVMRGEVPDQFGLEAALSDRMAAGKEIMKRLTEMAKVTAHAEKTNSDGSSVRIVLERNL